jgi:hypothetical protein
MYLAITKMDGMTRKQWRHGAVRAWSADGIMIADQSHPRKDSCEFVRWEDVQLRVQAQERCEGGCGKPYHKPAAQMREHDAGLVDMNNDTRGGAAARARLRHAAVRMREAGETFPLQRVAEAHIVLAAREREAQAQLESQTMERRRRMKLQDGAAAQAPVATTVRNALSRRGATAQDKRKARSAVLDGALNAALVQAGQCGAKGAHDTFWTRNRCARCRRCCSRRSRRQARTARWSRAACTAAPRSSRRCSWRSRTRRRCCPTLCGRRGTTSRRTLS